MLILRSPIGVYDKYNLLRGGHLFEFYSLDLSELQRAD